LLDDSKIEESIFCHLAS